MQHNSLIPIVAWAMRISIPLLRRSDLPQHHMDFRVSSACHWESDTSQGDSGGIMESRKSHWCFPSFGIGHSSWPPHSEWWVFYTHVMRGCDSTRGTLGIWCSKSCRDSLSSRNTRSDGYDDDWVSCWRCGSMLFKKKCVSLMTSLSQRLYKVDHHIKDSKTLSFLLSSFLSPSLVYIAEFRFLIEILMERNMRSRK